MATPVFDNSEIQERLLKEFVTKHGGTKKAPPIVERQEIVLTKVDTKGNITIGDLTGDKTSDFAEFKVTKYNDEDWHEDVRGFLVDPIPGYVYTPQFYMVLLNVEQGFNTMSWGESGSGKDTAFYQVCALTRRPYRRFTGMGGVTADVILGSKAFNEKGIYWQPGDADLICRHGGMLVISEPTTMNPEVLFALQSALEKGGYLSLIEHPDIKERMLPVNERTRFGFTSNVRGMGDKQSRYAATNVMDASTINRIQSYIYFPALAGDLLKKLILRSFPTAGEKFADKIVLFDQLMKTAIQSDAIEADWSWRNIEAWINSSLIYGSAVMGFKTTFFDRLSDVEQGAVRGFWATVELSGDI